MKTSLVFSLFLFGMAATVGAQQFVISTYAGGGPPPTPVAALEMAIAPVGMTADPSGNLYFISSNCVFKLDTNGIVTRIAGNARTGYSPDGAPALTAEFFAASGLAIDAGGNLYIADLGNYRVRKVSPAGIITTVAGNGRQGYDGDGGLATAAQLNGVIGLATDKTGNLFLVDGARIRKVSTTGIITTVAGDGSYGFSGDGGPAISAQLNRPSGIAVDSAGLIYIADDGNLRVRRISQDGTIRTVVGTGSYGHSGDGGPAVNSQLTGAPSIALDGAGNLYLTDSSSEDLGCSCVRKVSSSGIIATVATNSVLFGPRALAVDPAGNLYIADTGNGRIRRFSSSGVLPIVAGSGGNVNYGGDGGLAARAQLFGPTGIAIDREANVYVGDTYNNRVRVISPAGIITTITGTGVGRYSGDGGQAAGAEVYFPVGVAVDSRGNLYIADHGNSRIRKVSKAGVISTAVEPPTFPTVFGGSQVWGLVIDRNDNLLVPDPTKNRILKVTPDGVVTTVAGNGTHGYSGDGGPAISAQIRLTAKAALATDGEGNIYFSDDDVQSPSPGVMPSGTVSSPRIRKVSPDGTINTVAGNGTSGFSGDGGLATSAQLGSQLNYSVALAADNLGNLYIVDGDNGRIRMVTKAGTITTVAGTGVYGYSGDGGPAISAQLMGPSALATDAAGNVLVADGNAIRLLQPLSASLRLIETANAASHVGGAVAPGQIVVISGSGLGPTQLAVAAPGAGGVYPTQLAGTSVAVNGTPAPLIYTWATQVAFVVPYSVVSGKAQITLGYQGSVATLGPLNVAPSNAGIFTLDTSGEGQASALNADQSVNSAANAAKAGSVISLFVTGEGETSPAGVDGLVAQAEAPHPILPVIVTIDGTEVTPAYAGGSPGSVAGVMRIDVQIPSGVRAGPAVPVTVRVGSSLSQIGVTIAVSQGQ
jgi:uncharacterized protein (TIGR03437 family)